MIKASLVVLLGLLASGVLRRRSAATRHWVLAWALACTAVLPALEFVVPSWDAPYSLAWMVPSATESRLVFGDDPGGVQRANQPGRPGASSTAASEWHLPLVQRIWLGGSAVSLLLLAVGLGRLRRIASRATPVHDGPWARALEDVADARRRLPVRLVTGLHPAMLFTWGLWRPTIVLPASAPTWPAERIRAVLRHELAHVRRRDWAVHVFASVLRSVHWFNPLVWMACRQLRLASEQACDDAVLDGGMAAPDYAAHLLDVAQLFRRTGRPGLLPAVNVVRPSGFERRVAAMLTTGVDRSPRSGLIGLAAVSVLVLLTIPLAGLTAAPSPPSPETVVAGGALMPPVSGPAAEPQSDARAQTAISGTVKDPAGRTMPDVVVEVTPISAPGGPKPQVRTGPDGRFEIKGLPPGEYDVASARPGFKRNLIRVALKPNAPVALTIALQIGSLSETISVQGDRKATVGASKPAPLRATPSETARTGADPCDTSPVGGCLTPPRKLVDVKPVYPQALAARGLSANVVVKAILGVDGRLKDLEPEAGPDKQFVDAVLEAVRQWEFTPVRLNGAPQECQVTVTVRFSVQ